MINWEDYLQDNDTSSSTVSFFKLQNADSRDSSELNTTNKMGSNRVATHFSSQIAFQAPATETSPIHLPDAAIHNREIVPTWQINKTSANTNNHQLTIQKHFPAQSINTERSKWVRKHYLSSCDNDWQPHRISMSSDATLWKKSVGLNDYERQTVLRSLGFMSENHNAQAHRPILNFCFHFRDAHIRQYLFRQALSETLLNDAYQHCLNSLCISENDVFKQYWELHSTREKADWSHYHTSTRMTPELHERHGKTDEKLLRNLINYYAVCTGIFSYCGFVQILSIGRFHKMTGMAKQCQHILRDKTTHVNFGTELISHITHENPDLWNSEFQHNVIEMICEGTQLEIDYAHETLPRGASDTNATMITQYLQFIANQRLLQLGLPEQFPVMQNPLPWMAELTKPPTFGRHSETIVNSRKRDFTLIWD